MPASESPAQGRMKHRQDLTPARSPKGALWVPTLYLSESLPYAAVMLMSVILYQEMGLTDTQITLYTGWLSLPWIIKPLWSPIVDGLATKLGWILAMQLLIGAALALLAFTLPTSFWLQASLALFMLIAFSSATHDISADGFYIIALGNREQELFVGVRNTFYRIGMVLGQGGLVILAGLLQEHGCTVPIAWSATFLALAALVLLLFAYHRRILPEAEHGNDNLRQGNGMTVRQLLAHVVRDFCLTLKTFASKPFLLSSLLFILLFRLPEGLLTKIVPLFLKRPLQEGGLNLTDVQYGFVYGTLGVIGLLGGGLLGGWLVSRYGLRRMLWPLTLCITLPDVVYVWLSWLQVTDISVVASCVFIEQMGYGLGFTAYTLYLVAFSRGERSTSVFSLCTALQFLGGAMIPSMVSGWMSDSMGYTQFFCAVMAFCLVTFAVTALMKIPKEEG